MYICLDVYHRYFRSHCVTQVGLPLRFETRPPACFVILHMIMIHDYIFAILDIHDMVLITSELKKCGGCHLKASYFKTYICE